MKKTSYYLLILAVFTSCFKEEIPVDKPLAGNLLSNTALLQADYRYQSYYDFESNKFVHTTLKTNWNIGFSCISDSFYIVLNSSTAAAAKVYPNANFYTKTDTLGEVWKYDDPNGKLTQTACGELQLNTLYVFDLGFSYTGSHLGFGKLWLENLNNNTYAIKTAFLDNSNERLEIIHKNNTHNFAYYNFDLGIMEEIAPPKNNWDLLFTQYTHIFEDGKPYLVTGVVSNRNNVTVAEQFSSSFNSLSFNAISNAQFSSNIDQIGYDWKSFNGNNFTVDATKNYIVNNRNGLYFKIHFIDFYNAQGEKGFPQFEMQAL